jgi:hypothetical protein
MRTLSYLWLFGALSAAASCSGAPPELARSPVFDDAASRPRQAADVAPVGARADQAEATADGHGAKTAAEVSKAEDKRPRMGAISAFAYIYKNPSSEGLALGSIRMGTSVPLKTGQRVEGKGCGRGWYAVEPRGYACLNPQTTLDLEDPYFKALASVQPGPDKVWHYHYAFSNGAPMYSRVPTDAEAEQNERRFGARGSFVQLAEWSKGHEELLTNEPIQADGPVPEIFAGGTRHVGGGTRSPSVLLWRVIPNGSMVAYARSFEANGRTWLLTPDLMLVPADRVRALRRSKFHGVMLGDGVELPLAWNRTKQPKPKYVRKDGALVAEDGVFASKTWVQVTGERVHERGHTYLPIRGEADTFVDEADVTLSTKHEGELPKGVSAGERWLEVKILPGTMTAYEGDTPVRASLFSPGKGGVPVPGLDHTVYATTAMGFFPIEWKDHVATMSNEKTEPKVLWFTDVPHIQYLRAPLAMHVAYWHEDFGNPKSAECVNVAPEDGAWLFDWTLPHLPEGWGAIRPGDGNGKSTPVIVTAR